MADGSVAANGPGTNTPPLGDATRDIMFEFLERHQSIVDERKALNKQKRKLIEEIGKAGIPEEAWQHFIKTREQAGVIRERINSAWRQLMAWDNKPVGVQAGIDLTVSVDGEVNVHELKRIDNEGLEVGKGGRKRESNPYTPGTEVYARWDAAWVRGQSEIAAKMAPPPESPKPRGRPRRDGSPPRQRRQNGAEAAKL